MFSCLDAWPRSPRPGGQDRERTFIASAGGARRLHGTGRGTQTLFRQGHHWSYDLAELGHFARAHRLMDHWRAVLADRVLEVRYEELVADPEAGARRIVAHCGLAWDAACLSLDGAGRAVRTASVGDHFLMPSVH